MSDATLQQNLSQARKVKRNALENSCNLPMGQEFRPAKENSAVGVVGKSVVRITKSVMIGE